MNSRDDGEITSDGYRSNYESSYDDGELEFMIKTNNRFGQFENGGISDDNWTKTRTRRSKRKKFSSGSVNNTDKFAELNTDDKLTSMFDSINRNAEVLFSVESKQNQCLHDIQMLSSVIGKTNRRLSVIEEQVNKQTDQLKMLAYKSLDMEARSRRNNLIFWGLSENIRGDCKSLMFRFLSDELDINTSNMCIERAHRLGALRKQTNGDQKRPIIVRFNDYNDTEYIMSNVYKLKHTPFGVDRDYPHEIAQARRELYQSNAAQEARQHKVKCQIKYPAMLYIGGKFEHDMFPDWFTVLKGSRVAGFNHINTSAQISHDQHLDNRRCSDMYMEHSVYSNKTIVDSPVPSEVFTPSLHSRERHIPSDTHVTERPASKPTACKSPNKSQRANSRTDNTNKTQNHENVRLSRSPKRTDRSATTVRRSQSATPMSAKNRQSGNTRIHEDIRESPHINREGQRSTNGHT